jgi:protein-tyrosine-phosphatase
VEGSLDPAIELHVARMVDALAREFAGRVERAEVERLMHDSIARLRREGRLETFLPVLGYRFTRERLQALTRGDGGASEARWTIVFVGRSDGGRSQLAAALTGQLMPGPVNVHSAGIDAGADLDPAVREVLQEMGADNAELFAKPLTDEVLAGADVVVTLARSLGKVAIPDGVRNEDWRIGDPIGADVREVRRIRDDLERRVRDFCEMLEAEQAHATVAAEAP